MGLAMAEAERRIRLRVGDDDIRVHYTTAKGMVDQRLGYFDAPTIVHMSARGHDETVSVAIGIRPDGRLATLEGTPERRQQEWEP